MPEASAVQALSPLVMLEASAFEAFALSKMNVVDEWLPVCGRFEKQMLPA
jgi:hypothetical protein